MRHLSKTIVAALAFLPLTLLPGSTSQQGPEYTADGQLKFPTNYREWVFLSSGIGMTYGPVAALGDRGPQLFDNVFVNPDAYRAFLESGHWPEKTVFILEVRNSESHASINKGGHFQTDITGIEAEVKDSSAKNGPWNFYGFSMATGKPSATAKAVPHTASCFNCHGKNTAVENTFVQFYPSLYEVAERKGTFNPGFERLPVTPGKLRQMIRSDGWPKGEAALENAAVHAPEAAVLTEGSLNMIGYQMIQSGQPGSAVGVLEWAAARYPKSANLQDSLAEAYLADGRKEAARLATERSMALLDADASMASERRERLAASARKRLELVK